ncbi:MAG TPA: sulfotransferase [Jatrophihabitans sp.]
MALPDFLVIGAPKAGSTAVHDALVRHPELFLSTPKEPKYFMTDGATPRRGAHRGPSDAHSAREWIWRRDDYEALFDRAPTGTLRGESTPFYLWDSTAHRRIRETVPDVKLIAIIRDPVDRAYSNWTHLWCDGLETEPDFVTACRREPERVAAGFAPFWRYLELGKYGEQLQRLFDVFPREQVHVLRYKDLVDQPAKSLDAVCEFLCVEPGLIDGIPSSNMSGWANGGIVNSALRRTIRTGATLGAYTPPSLWRRAQAPLVRALRRERSIRPHLGIAARRELVEYFRADIGLLENVLGKPFHDWVGDSGRGTYAVRKS